MRVYFFLGIIVASISSCGKGGNHKTKLITIGEESRSSDAEQPDTSAETESSTKDISFLPLRGSSMRFVDARGLTKMYARVFPITDNGYQHCKSSPPRTVSFCFDSIFSSSERVHMGAFDIFNPNGQRGPSNLNRPRSLTLNYLRSLRAGLARECSSLVAKEMQNFEKGDVSTNLLVVSDSPSVNILEGFAKKIMGIANFDLKVDVDAKTYVESFKNALATSQDPVKDKKQAYIALCVAVASDPQIILY